MSYAEFLATKSRQVQRAGIDVIESDINPILHQWQKEIVCWAVKIGRAAVWADCVAADTVVHGPDGDQRIDVLAESGKPFRVWSLTPEGERVAATALFAFKKGRAPLHEYTLDDGRSIKVTERHRFLSRQGWTFAADVSVGSEIASAVHSTSPVDAQRSTRTAAGSTDRCSPDCRRCDPQPQSAEGTGRSETPSPVGALGLGAQHQHSDALARTPSRSPRRQGSGHPSTPDSHHQGNCVSGADLSPLDPSHPIRLASTFPTLPLSALSATRLQSTVVSVPREDQAATGERSSILCEDQPRSGLCQPGASRAERQNWNSRTRQQSGPHSTLPQSNLESDRYAGLTETASLTFRRVVRIQYIGVTDYYDMHVPGWENYCANEIWHHNTGLGKTFMQIEWARLSGETTLIVAPLAVCAQTVREAAKLGVTARYVRSDEEITGAGIFVTNYEMVEHFDPIGLDAVVLDESSILKNSTGATRTILIEHFRPVERRLSCTATPAPNDPEELTNQAEFLGVMSRVEMLSAYFVHDSDEGWRLKGHARGPMFQWMASWALAIRRPSDLGYPDDGYVLPGLDIREHLLDVDVVPDGELFATELGGVGGRAQVRRATMQARCEKAAELVAAEPDEPWLIWCGLNDESDLLTKLIPGAVNVHGSMSPEEKARLLLGFADGDFKYLITKLSMASFGLNYQHCARLLFVGMNDSYEGYYQGVRRCYRYGQKRIVVANVVLSTLEGQIAANVRRKEYEGLHHTKALVKSMRAARIGTKP